MENNQQNQSAGKEQQQAGEQNPTLHQPGTQVADYGNVTGGASDAGVQEQGQNEGNEGRSGSKSGANETVGNP